MVFLFVQNSYRVSRRPPLIVRIADINLPVGAISAVCMVFFFVAPRTAKVEDATLKEKLLQLDPVGVVLVMGLAISYVLALQYAGNRGRWSDADIIGLLVAFALITIIFIFWEWFQGEQAMMVPRIILQRDVGIASAVIFFYAGSFFALAYYMPLYFQAIGGATPIMSGGKRTNTYYLILCFNVRRLT